MNKAVCTIVTKSYLPYARALAHQVKKYNPDVKMYVLVTDYADGYYLPEDESCEIIQLHQLGHQDSIQQMSQYYTAFEFCNALRPLIHEYLLEQTDHDAWVYLDSDIHVVASLDEIFDEIARFNILVSPHCWNPDESADPLEHTFLKYGIYNSGFLGVRRSEESKRFVEWFRNRLEFHCLEDSHCFVDQSWLNLVPLFFEDVTICKHAGTNISFWNLHERKFEEVAQGEYRVNGQNLLFLHFSGGDLENPENVFTKYKKFRGEVPDGMRVHFREYSRLLTLYGINETSSWPYSFSQDEQGLELTKARRREIRGNCIQQIEQIESKHQEQKPPRIKKLWNKIKRKVFPASSSRAA